MSSAIPKLKNALARQALIHFFNNSYWSREELEYLNGFCSMHNTDKVLKLKTRLLTEENNDMLVASVLADATPDEFKFLHDKYRLGHTFTKISMELHVHPNALQRWRDKFLEELGDLIEYKLPDSDIFSRNKVEAPVFVLRRLTSRAVADKIDKTKPLRLNAIFWTTFVRAEPGGCLPGKLLTENFRNGEHFNRRFPTG